MAEETLLEVEAPQDRATIASYFRQFADGLENDGEVTFSTAENEASLTIPETAEFELEVESETEEDETEYEIEFEIEWSTEEEEQAEDAVLQIGGEPEEQQETIEESVGEAEPAASDEREAAEGGDEGAEGSQ